eukprot:TRINITY_DN48301_c0_g1_i1.p1 TRINITY_DN48301_c0_g1~~TRINITY_DN48301_c0_g1_i1.p1  ORF type:complete len:677 (-),score=146.30 TRINITY_DN48301_c0_g1_i1:259-2007(-)
MDPPRLLAIAQKGGFYSYVAGVAYQVLQRHQVGGLVIDNHTTTLPVKKGLSSSAAVTVLVARAFNRAYDLRLTVSGEMDLAYRGEITTPSRCGRMDQCCAFGQVPVWMEFDGDAVESEEVIIKSAFYFVVVDLNAAKDTMEILAKLSRGFPKASDDLERRVQEFLGPINKRILAEARAALESGDAPRLGQLYNEFQELFDSHLMPACPSQLTAPVLHKTLRHLPLQEHILGCKGVGSQGDGTAQFLCKSEEAQREVVRILESDLGMSCLMVTLGKKRRVRKALIPCAGYSVHMYPATKVGSWALLPLMDHDGYCKPAIFFLVQEALSAGVDEVVVIVQKHDLEDFDRFFHREIPIENFNQLSAAQRELGSQILEMGKRVTLVVQSEQRGLADAVLCGREKVGSEPFLLMLGDHLYTSTVAGVSCGRQITDRFSGQSVIALQQSRGEDVHRMGAVAGEWEHEGGDGLCRRLHIQAISEKPTLDYAREHLQVEGIDDDRFLTFFGSYVLTARVFDILARDPHIHFSQALNQLRQEQGLSGLLVQGERFDIGEPNDFMRTSASFADARRKELQGFSPPLRKSSRA